jgi:hypothetical protein
MKSDPSEIGKKVRKWRSNAIRKLKAMPEGKDRERLARKLYEADEMSIKSGAYKPEWKQIKPFLEKETKQEKQKKRDQIVKVRSICGEQTYYRESWKPTLEQFREKHPFDPFDDLRKPFRNKQLKPKAQKNDESSRRKHKQEKAPDVQKNLAVNKKPVPGKGLPESVGNDRGSRRGGSNLNSPRLQKRSRERDQIRREFDSLEGPASGKRAALDKRLEKLDQEEAEWREQQKELMHQQRSKSRIWKGHYKTKRSKQK